MAQQNAASAGNKSIPDKSKTQGPKPLEPQHHFKSSEPVQNSLSPAELYINQRSQMLFESNDAQPGGSCITSSTNSVKYAEKMHEWREEEVNKIYKQEPYRYRYGTPSSSTFHRINSRTDSYDVQTSNSSSSTNRKMKK